MTEKEIQEIKDRWEEEWSRWSRWERLVEFLDNRQT